MQILLDRINELCQARGGMSLNALERATGLSINSICKWGESTPSGDKILKVAIYFDVSVDYLLGYTDNAKSHKNGGAAFATAINKLYAATNEVKQLLNTNYPSLK